MKDAFHFIEIARRVNCHVTRPLVNAVQADALRYAATTVTVNEPHGHETVTQYRERLRLMFVAEAERLE